MRLGARHVVLFPTGATALSTLYSLVDHHAPRIYDHDVTEIGVEPMVVVSRVALPVPTRIHANAQE